MTYYDGLVKKRMRFSCKQFVGEVSLNFSIPHTCHGATFLITLIHVTEQIPEMPPPSSQSRRLHETTPVTTVAHASHVIHDHYTCFCCVLVPIFAPRLTFKFPTWRWEAGDANLRASYLPQEQQYLITRRGLQRLRLLGMSKQGKTGTPPPSIFLTFLNHMLIVDHA